MTKLDKKVRGVYDHPKGSKIYWCQYFADGQRHRERAGNKSNAIALYQKRKAAIRAGEKLPLPSTVTKRFSVSASNSGCARARSTPTLQN